MTSADDKPSPEDQYVDQLGAWQSSSVLAHPVNGDLSLRVVNTADDAQWQPCPIPNTEVRLLEYRIGSNPRFTALLRLTPDTPVSNLGFWRKLEALVFQGSLTIAQQEAQGGSYVRLPDLQHTLCLNDGKALWPLDGHMYVAYSGGNYSDEDSEPRLINTETGDAWLPGPTDGIEVLPLHVHGSASAMLIRWNQSATFQPQLDPKGEEILVLNGSLSDERGHYTTGTWIRNPEISWQQWSGTADTVVFYKSGHFKSGNGSD